MQFIQSNKFHNCYDTRHKFTRTKNGYYAHPANNSNKTHGLRYQNISLTKAKWVPKLKTSPSKPSKDSSKCRELLVSGYCRNSLNIKIIETIDLYCRPISEATERAIASAHFFAHIIDNYQNNVDNKCPFITDDKDFINLNQYIYIRGGALRDTMLSRDINDIDFVIDTVTLNNIYYDHLIKYHSKKSEQQSINCSCYLWQRYLNMYYKNTANDRIRCIDVETDEIKKLEQNMVRSEFLLNGRFFKSIIINSSFNTEESINTIDAIPTWEYTNWVLNIDKTLLYNNIDLKGARFDIGDEMSNCTGSKPDFNSSIVDKNQMVFQSKWNDCFDYLRNLKTYDSVPLSVCTYENKFEDVKHNYEIIKHKSYDNDDDKIKNELIVIKLPLYAFNLKYSHQYCDFTINGLRLPLVNVYRMHGAYNNIDFNWYSKIFQYSYARNNQDIKYLDHNKMAIKDIKNKMIRQPDIHILNVEYMYNDYFWRFIKILTKFVDYIYYNIEWKVDEKTLNELKHVHQNHFKLLDDGKMTEFINRLLFWNINNENFESVFKSRLIVFKMINIDYDIKQAFKLYPAFKMYLQCAVTARLDGKKQEYVSSLLRAFGYGNLLSVNGEQCNNIYRNTYNSNRNNAMYSTRIFQ